MLTTAAGFAPGGHKGGAGVPPHKTVGSYLGTDVKLWFQANSVLRRPLAIWKLCVEPGKTVVLMVWTFDCPGLGAWNPVLAVSRNASQSITFSRAWILPSVVEPKEL